MSDAEKRRNTAGFTGFIMLISLMVCSATGGAIGYSMFINMMCGG